jgi:hypothetical protein
MKTPPYYKMQTFQLLLAFLLFASFRMRAQGTFQNLNFEQANPVIVVGSPYYPYEVTAASALPYWTVSYGGVQQSQILFNDSGAGGTLVDLVGTGAVYAPQPIDGNYSVYLQGGGTASAASISQSGTIPSGTQSLLFEAEPGHGTLDVFVGTQMVPFMALATGANYTLYGANISAWAGQTEQLTFSALEDLSVDNNWEVDDISFSPSAVPEPGTLALMLMAFRAYGVRRWRARD